VEQVEMQVYKFCTTWQSLNKLYEEYAKSVNISYTSLIILILITRVETCTQKLICEQTFLPKQTVNSVITAFYREGYVELKELPTDRRNKTIHLTEEGKKFADKIVPKLREAEYKAMESLSPQQREDLLEGIDIYYKAFRKTTTES
jgi:DNA-binding MarR family transcriptional regulator